MNLKALIFSIAGAVVALFYAFESFLTFQSSGIVGPLFTKLAICGIGVYFCLRNIKSIKNDT